MSKFIKNLFSPTEKKNDKNHEGLEEYKDAFTPPLDGRRKLSISRSGRMKQANKKRRSLTLDVYGEDHKFSEKPTSASREYHVHGKSFMQQTITMASDRNKIAANNSSEDKKTNFTAVTPDEAIDNAFEIIDKT